MVYSSGIFSSRFCENYFYPLVKMYLNFHYIILCITFKSTSNVLEILCSDSVYSILALYILAAAF